MSNVELVVFDMVGTTIEHGYQVASAFETALKRHDIPATEGEIQERMGASKREILRFFVERHHGRNPESSEKTKHVYKDFDQLLTEYYADGGARSIAGVEQTMSWLRDHDIKVALTTGFDRKVTDTILQSVGWSRDLIDASFCGDDVPQGRPAPYMIFRALESTGVMETCRVMVVGDTALDLQAGSNAGAGAVVGVLSGSHSIEQLGKARHTHIVSSAKELPELIRRTLL